MQKTAGNKSESKRRCCRTQNSRSKPPYDCVTEITAEGFWLWVGGKEYFLSFDNFPWFRYADDDAISAIEVCPGDPEWGGAFQVKWVMLDVLLGTNHIIWHGQHPIIVPHPIRYPQSEGKLEDRVEHSETREYQAEVTFTYKGAVTVSAENADACRRIIAEQCQMECGGMLIDTPACSTKTVPFGKVEWDFPWRVEPAKVGKIKEVR